MQTKNIAFVFVFFVYSTNAFAWKLFGPSDFDDCILESMKGVKSNSAASAIYASCEKKFKTPDTSCSPKEFSAEDRARVQGTASVNYGYFSAQIYNGSKTTIRELIVGIIPETNRPQAYKITPIAIEPLYNSEVSTKVMEQNIKKLNWEIISIKGCE